VVVSLLSLPLPSPPFSLLAFLMRSLTHLCSVTQATNTKNIRLVFAAVKETILQNALKDSGIL
jgi:guanine nucleotide-binding protein subunit alpha